MKPIRTAVLVTILIFMLFLPACFAALEWNVLNTLKLNDQPLDMAFSTTRNHIYVLNNKGEILIYDPTGRLLDKMIVDKNVDRIKLVPNSDVLLLSNSKGKEISIVRLDFIQKFNLSGSPFKGPENAPVVIVEFSEFQ